MERVKGATLGSAELNRIRKVPGGCGAKMELALTLSMSPWNQLEKERRENKRRRTKVRMMFLLSIERRDEERSTFVASSLRSAKRCVV